MRTHEGVDGHHPALHHLRRLDVWRGVPSLARQTNTEPRRPHGRPRLRVRPKNLPDYPDTSASVPGLAAGPASRPLLHYGDQFDLDHRLGLGEAADLDRRAGWSGDAEIAHAHVAALREGFVVGDEGIGLDHIGPGGAGCLEAGIQVLEGLLQLRAHVAGADDLTAGVAGELAGGVD